MAILSNLQKLVERSSESKVDRNNLLREIVNRKYTCKYIAKVNTSQVDEFSILVDPTLTNNTETVYNAAAGTLIPNTPVPLYWGAAHPTDPLATITSIVPTFMKDSRRYVYIEVVYETNRVVDLWTDDPLNQPPEVYYSSYKYDMPMVFDQYGVPTLSSAGNRLDPIPTMPVLRALVTVTRNIAEFPLGKKRFFQYTLNSQPFLKQQINQVRINEITAKRTISQGVVFWQENIEFEIRYPPDTFFDYFLDNDYRDRTGFIFRDPFTLHPYSTPTLLNGRGKNVNIASEVLQNNMDANTKTVVINDASLFPPAQNPALPDGMVVGPQSGTAMIMISDITNPTRFETMRVVGGLGTTTMTVDRKMWAANNPGGNWAADGATIYVTLLAYYNKFIPHRQVDFTPLNIQNLRLE